MGAGVNCFPALEAADTQLPGAAHTIAITSVAEQRRTSVHPWLRRELWQ